MRSPIWGVLHSSSVCLPIPQILSYLPGVWYLSGFHKAGLIGDLTTEPAIMAEIFPSYLGTCGLIKGRWGGICQVQLKGDVPGSSTCKSKYR